MFYHVMLWVLFGNSISFNKTHSNKSNHTNCATGFVFLKHTYKAFYLAVLVPTSATKRTLSKFTFHVMWFCIRAEARSSSQSRTCLSVIWLSGCNKLLSTGTVSYVSLSYLHMHNRTLHLMMRWPPFTWRLLTWPSQQGAWISFLSCYMNGQLNQLTPSYMWMGVDKDA